MEFSPPPKKPLSFSCHGPTSNISETMKPQEYRGLRLIQLLLTCAAHVSSGNLNLADTCLRQISHLSSVSGDSMQRLAARFASSLATRLIKRWPGLHAALDQTSRPEPDDRTARLAFSRALPYVGFAHAVIHGTILRAMSEERVIHIVDLGSGDPALWGPLLHAFSRCPGGPPHLKITSVHASRDTLDHLGSALIKRAEALDIPFQFNPLNLSLKDLNLEQLKVRTGEALAICSMLSLHVLLAEEDDRYKPCKQMDVFLAMVRSVSPKVFVVAEQDSDHNSGRLVDRFVEGLYHYSALFDSIEAAARSLSLEERMAVEDMLGRQIESVVACEGVEREERHERAQEWMVRFARAGFRPIRLWGEAMEDARQKVDSYGIDGYKVVSERMFLIICWHERTLYSVSAWHS